MELVPDTTMPQNMYFVPWPEFFSRTELCVGVPELTVETSAENIDDRMWHHRSHIVSADIYC